MGRGGGYASEGSGDWREDELGLGLGRRGRGMMVCNRIVSVEIFRSMG